MLTRPVQIRPIVTIGRPRQSPLSKAPARLAPVLTLNGSSSSSSSCSAILARPLSRNSTSGTLHCPSLPFPSFFPVAPLAWLSFAQLFFPAHLLSYYDKQRFSGSVAVKDCWGFMLPGSHVAAEASISEPNSVSYNAMITGFAETLKLDKDGRWEDVAEARKMLKCTGVKKEPGHSFMEVKGIAEKFTVGQRRAGSRTVEHLLGVPSPGRPSRRIMAVHEAQTTVPSPPPIPLPPLTCPSQALLRGTPAVAHLQVPVMASFLH
ncbi:hypothetical protein MUK42_33216 [Musa troglodytarum]|uniref:Uncharacterized protein n=1 Tax=Musa troglodytarum TaxID=320322 RepID=A0A9E7H8M3_9LILI|nr:hypothetical protein MUK42_33216 [Musa troglodytarum]